MKWLLILLGLMAIGAGPAVAWDPMQSARRAASDGQRAFAEGDTTAAIRNLMRAQALAPEDGTIRMGLGETLYRAREYESARRQFESIGIDPLGEFTEPALYNAGNAAFDAGDLETALELYTRALLEGDGQPAKDLLHNLELTQRLIEEQQQQQEQSGDQESEDKNQEESDQQDQNEQNQQQEQQQDQEQEQDEEQQQEQQPQEQEQQQPEQESAEDQQEADQTEGEQPQQMTPEEAMRLLQALDADEEELRKSIQRRLRGDEKEAEHDW